MGDPRDVLTRPAPPPDLTVRYGDHPDQLADVWLPAGGPAPLVLFLHGGFWRAQWDRTHAGPLAADLAARGHAVATVEYRRVGQPGGGWPGTFEDVAVAVDTVPGRLVDRVGPDRVDLGRVIVAGHSAGGHLALWVAGGLRHVRGVLALAPVSDLTEAYRRDLDGGAVRDLLRGGPDELPGRYAVADPRARLPLGLPAVLVHGTDDAQVPVELSRGFAAAAGDSTRLVELAGVEHFALIDPASAAWPVVLQALDSLLA